MAGTVIADNLQAASTSQLVIKNGVASTPPTIQDSAGTQIGTFCRAWVNFNGTGTVAIRASFNVSSITDNGTGNYTVNFTNAMPDANYSAFASIRNDPANGSNANGAAVIGIASGAAPSTTACPIVTGAPSNATAYDYTSVFLSIFR